MATCSCGLCSPQQYISSSAVQVGVGVLGLPYAFSYLGWAAGFLFLGLCFMTSLYTSYLLAALHEGPDSTRRNRYKDLGQAVLGELLDRQNLCPKVLEGQRSATAFVQHFFGM